MIYNDSRGAVMKRRAFSLIELLTVLAVVVMGAAIVYPMFARSRETCRVTPQNRCQLNLKQLSLGVAMYGRDYNEHLPLVALSPTSTALVSTVKNQRFYGWADALYPYTRSVQLFQCLSEATPSNMKPTTCGYTDYWLNSNVSGIALEKIASPSTTIAFGDGNDGADLTDARYNLPSLPQAWINTPNSPARRHLDGANYVFVDTHVKWLKPADIPGGNQYTFAPR